MGTLNFTRSESTGIATISVYLLSIPPACLKSKGQPFYKGLVPIMCHSSLGVIIMVTLSFQEYNYHNMGVKTYPRIDELP